MRLHSLILKLQDMEHDFGDREVLIVVGGVAHDVNDIWLESAPPTSTAKAANAVCIGDDLR